MLFFDEAVAETEQALGGQPGWTVSKQSDNRFDCIHQASGTELRVFGNGAVVVINDHVLAAGHLRYDEALRHTNSMDQFIGFAQALVIRDRALLVRWVGPHGINL